MPWDIWVSEYQGDFDQLLKHEDSIKNVYDKISGSFGKNKANNRQIFLQVLQSIKQKAVAQVSSSEFCEIRTPPEWNFIQFISKVLKQLSAVSIHLKAAST